MEPDVIRMYSSSPPPLEEGVAGDEEDDEFSDFAVPGSVSFSEFETATTFDQLRALSATSPPELMVNGRVPGLHESAGCRVVGVDELKRGAEHAERTNSPEVPGGAVNGVDVNEGLTNGFASHKGPAFLDDAEDFADFAAFTDAPGFGRLSNGVCDEPDPGASPATPVSLDGDETETETSFGRALSTEALEEFGDFSTTASLPSPPLQEDTPTAVEDDADFGDFGDFATRPDERPDFAEFPSSESFADFSSAPVGGSQGADSWSEDTGGSWAAFGQDQGLESTPDQPFCGRRDSLTASLLSRLEKLLLLSFPEVSAPQLEGDVPAIRSILEEATPAGGVLLDVWRRLQDVHSALGLRHQWGGSHCNKVLLCSLGIDTRNILFTGQKKQPVIVPMYAASLGMLEPTKEPVKPVSAAEMIASIAQSGPSPATEISAGPADTAQEPLPPVQFDWSSSGLTNPLDASGGSALLNLDFFGPVDESPCGSSTSMPGVDPELYELTQTKPVVSVGGNKVADAFARLMSTAEKTNTSTRRVPQKEENLSEEAHRVISALPDLSFMQAKVLMFPSTLTPLPPSSSSSPSPVPD